VTVRDVSARLLRHPVRSLIHRWHWKSAALSAIVRGSLFFATNLSDGFGAAVRATVVECASGVPVVGVLAAVIQAFSCAEPAWAATLVTSVLLPAVAQTIEFAAHWAAGTPQLGTSMLASVGLSVMSTLFNLFVMRRGVMIVGRGSPRFVDDVRQMPGLIVAFVLTLPRTLARPLRCAPPCARL
jgi:hypothetical protein